MFGTISTFAVATSRNRSYGRRLGLVLTFSATVLSPCFSQMAQADVPTPFISSTLSPSLTHTHVGRPPAANDAFTERMVIHKLQLLTTKPDGSLNEPYARKLGFDLPAHDAEVFLRQARLSFPIPVFQIGLKRLQQFDSLLTVSISPLGLLAAEDNWIFIPPSFSFLTPQRILYAITINDVVHSSVRVRVAFSSHPPNPNHLNVDTERIGSGTLIRQIDKWRRDPSTRQIRGDYFLVWVPALDRYYLGRLQNQDFLIRAITDDPQVGLSEGEERDARAVFLKLKTEASTINADDPDAPPR